MKLARWIVAVALFSSALPAYGQVRTQSQEVLAPPAQASGPLMLVYRFPGVADNGAAAGSGVATAVLCTNTSSTSETLQILVRNFDTSLVGSPVNATVPSGHTFTASTHFMTLFSDDALFNTGLVNQGYAAVGFTSTSIVCTAMIVMAVPGGVPQAVALHGVRYNPDPFTQE